ncbi:MAG: hypothetical protein RQ801_07370 [Spirochaetaceae bacterium]|nr:hypothetical protein [Spirochaetaceae bacterium]MDT8298101.1 hypothetical protein [Spirochaetaceae bacterium]
MNDRSESTRISLRLADGEFFPIFRYGDPDTRNLSLVPATEGQEEADIQFYFHPSDGGEPSKLGTVRFPDLPVEAASNELFLDAVIARDGMLTVTVRHRESGRVERMDVSLPEEDGKPDGRREKVRSGNRGFRWVFGIIFVLAGLTLAFWLIKIVTDWGKQDALPTPVSRVIDRSGRDIA